MGLLCGMVSLLFTLPVIVPVWTLIGICMMPWMGARAYQALVKTRRYNRSACGVAVWRVLHRSHPSGCCAGRVGINIKVLLFVTLWIPAILWPVVSALAAVAVGVFSGLACAVLIFSDGWNVCEHVYNVWKLTGDFIGASRVMWS